MRDRVAIRQRQTTMRLVWAGCSVMETNRQPTDVGTQSRSRSHQAVALRSPDLQRAERVRHGSLGRSGSRRHAGSQDFSAAESSVPTERILAMLMALPDAPPTLASSTRYHDASPLGHVRLTKLAGGVGSSAFNSRCRRRSTESPSDALGYTLKRWRDRLQSKVESARC